MLDNFLDQIDNSIQEFGHKNVWFRGHSSVEYKLLPTALRDDKRFSEQSLFYDYKTHVAALNGSNKSNWELLLDMQHFGLPTRLLDWTSSLGTAIYFAIKNNPTSPCIWILEPYELSKLSTGRNIVFDTSSITDRDSSSNYTVHSLIGGSSEFDIPFSIQPPHGNKRIAAQRGMFTIHGKSRKSLEEQCPKFIKRIDIPLALIGSLKRYLKSFGIDELSLFPDYSGLTEHLLDKYSI